VQQTTVIVGAGISGLCLARTLQARGEHVLVLEKSRGVGGRMATKRVGDAVFDHGAQYVTAREAMFRREVDAWTAQGVAASWPGSGARRFIGRPAMTAIAKHLAAGVPVQREHTVTAVRRQGGVWHLDVEQRAAVRATRLVLLAPVPEGLALLAAGDVQLPEPWHRVLDALQYRPCLALLVVLGGPSTVPSDGVTPEDGPIRWIADNTRKGVSPDVPAAVTIHLSPEFSQAHFTAGSAEIADAVLPLARPWLGDAAVLSTTLHRWKFSEPVTTCHEPFVWLAPLAIGFCGDAFGGPKVEGAAMSGLALADHLSATA
jgi:renalase